MSLAIVADFAASLSFLAVLAWSVPALRRLLPDGALGLLFGAVAVLMMHAPLEVMPGTIIDLRAIAIALAGALLRPSGLLVCLGMALAVRYGLGGGGATAGLVAIVVAGVAGRTWAVVMTRRALRPGPVAFVALAALASLHLSTFALLPTPEGRALFWTVGLAMLGTNLVAIPTLAALAFRGRHAPVGQEGWLDLSTGMLSAGGLRRAWAQRRAADLTSRGTGMLVLRLRHGGWAARTFGGASLDAAMGAVRARLDAVLPREDLVARLGPTEVVVLSPDGDALTHRALALGLARQVGGAPVILADGTRLPVQMETGTAWADRDADLDDLLAAARAAARPTRDRPATGHRVSA